MFALFNLGLQEIIILVMLAVLGLAGAGAVFAVLFATGVLGRKQDHSQE